MTIEKRYRDRYKSGNTPWDVGKPDFNLVETVDNTPVMKCKALDVGCGTGDNSIWLARKGFDVTGTDISEIALEKATEKAAEAEVECNFIHIDFLNTKIKGHPFRFVFDRGCFHSFGSEDDRKRYAQNVSDHLEDDGLWLTLAGNADEDRPGPGPPQLSALDIVLTVESCFEILLLQSSRFESNSPNPPRAWKCLMKKRN